MGLFKRARNSTTGRFASAAEAAADPAGTVVETGADAYTRKQQAAGPGRRYYGDGGTIHGSTTIDVVLDDTGTVVEVWFRCQALSFSVSQPKGTAVYGAAGGDLAAVTGIEVVDAEASP